MGVADRWKKRYMSYDVKKDETEDSKSSNTKSTNKSTKSLLLSDYDKIYGKSESSNYDKYKSYKDNTSTKSRTVDDYVKNATKSSKEDNSPSIGDYAKQIKNYSAKANALDAQLKFYKYKKSNEATKKLDNTNPVNVFNKALFGENTKSNQFGFKGAARNATNTLLNEANKNKKLAQKDLSKDEMDKVLSHGANTDTDEVEREIQQNRTKAQDLTYKSYSKQSDFEDNSKYVPTIRRTGTAANLLGSGEDKDYEYINDFNGARNRIKNTSAISQLDTKRSDNKFEMYDYMTDDERKTYNYIYKTKGQEEAQKYIKFIDDDLYNRRNTEVAERMYNFTEEHPVLGSAATVPASLMSGGEYLKSVGERVTGQNKPIEKNAVASIASQAGRQGFTDTHNDLTVKGYDVGDLLYNTGMSAVDSLTAGALSGGTTGVAGSMLGLSAAQQATMDIKSRGGSEAQAINTGITAGIFESLFEEISIGKFKSLTEVSPRGVKDIAKNVAKSMGVNASEEALTEIANISYDTIANGSISNYQLSMQQYMEQGMSEEDAKKKALSDLAGQVLEAGVSGGIMGAGFGAVGSGIGYVNNRESFKNTANTINDAGQSEDVRSFAENQGINPGKTDVDLGRVAEDVASKVVDDMNNAKSINELNKVYDEAISSGSTGVANVANTYYTYNSERLAGTEDVVDREDTVAKSEKKLLAPQTQVQKIIANGDINDARAGIIADSKSLSSQFEQESGVKLVGSKAEKTTQIKEFVNNTNNSIDTQENSVIDESVKPQTATINNSKTKVIVKGIRDVTRDNVMLKTNTGTVSINDISFDDIDTEKLYSYASSYDADAANYFVENKPENVSLDLYKKTFNKYYSDGLVGKPETEVMGSSVYSDIIGAIPAKMAYDFGVKKAERISAKAVSYDQQDVTEAFAKATGIKVEFLDDIEGANGKYENGTVYISKKSLNPAMVVLSHETTHYLKESAPEAYSKYEKVVLDYFKTEHESQYTNLLAHMSEKYGTTDMNLLNEEIVANASETFLTDAEAVGKFVKENRTIAQKIFEHIKTFLQKLKKLYKGYSAQSREGKMLADDIEVLEKAKKIWFEALKEIGEIGETESAEDTDTLRYSLKDTLGEEQWLDGIVDNTEKDQVTKILESGFKALKNQKVDKIVVRKVASRLKAEYRSEYSINVLADNLEKVFAHIQSQDKVSYNDMLGIMTEVTKPVIEQSVKVDPEIQKAYKDFRKYLKETKVSLSTEQKAELQSYYDSTKSGSAYEQFRRSVFGRIRLAEDGTNIDSLWPEMVDASQGYLSNDTNSNDMIFALVDALEGMKPQTYNNFGMDNEKAAYDMALRVYEEYFKAKNTYDTNKAKIELNKKAKKWRTKQKAKYDERLKELRLKDKLSKDAQKDKMRFKMQQLKASHKESNHMRVVNERNRAKVQKYRNRIMKNSKDMIKWLNNPTDQKHVPEALRKTTLGLLTNIDFVSSKADVSSANSTKWFNYMQSIKDKFDEMNDDNADILMALDPDFMGRLKEFVNVDNKNWGKVSDLNHEQLKELDYIISILKSSITSVNKMYANKMFERVSEIGDRTLTELAQLKTKGVTKKIAKPIDKLFNTDMLDSFTYFEKLGDASYSVFQELRDGFDVRVDKLSKAQEHTKDILKDVNVKTWTGDKAEVHEFGKMKITTGQLMSLYILYQRDQAKQHILRGGIKIPDIKNTRQTEAYHFSEQQLNKLFDKLTPEQIKVAKAMQEYMSGECSEWGNEVSMNMYGYKKFTEKNYFPIKVDSNSTKTNDENSMDANKGQSSLYAIRNQGMTKSIVKGAKNTVVIDDIFDVYTEHICNMANYNAFTIPLTDAMKWYNYKVTTTTDNSDYTRSVKGSIERTHGREAKAYFINLIKDINNEVSKGYSSEITSSLMGKYKAAAVGGNIRVAIQQPTAYARAAFMLDTKYLIEGMAKKPAIQKAKDNSGIAKWKSWGFYETMIGQSMKQIITGQQTPLEKVLDKTMILASMGDEITWGTLWNACEAEIKHTRKDLTHDSPEFLKAVSQRFNNIIDRTQVVDSVFHRSQFMRSQDTGVKMEAAFMSEPTKTYNMVYGALMSGDKAKLAKAITVFVISNTVTSAIAAISDALRDRESDDWIEAYLKAFKDNEAGSLNPLSYVPYIRQITNLLSGYTVARMDMAGFQTLATSINATKKYASNSETSKQTPYTLAQGYARGASQVLGMPFFNVWRDIESIYNTIFDEHMGYTKDNLSKTYKEAYINGSLEERKEIRQKMIDTGYYKDVDKTIQRWITDSQK